MDCVPNVPLQSSQVKQRLQHSKIHREHPSLQSGLAGPPFSAMQKDLLTLPITTSHPSFDMGYIDLTCSFAVRRRSWHRLCMLSSFPISLLETHTLSENCSLLISTPSPSPTSSEMQIIRIIPSRRQATKACVD